MARVTIEDCIKRMPNRFALVHAAVRRTRRLMEGAKPLIPSKNREAVTALREIAAGKVTLVETIKSKGETEKKALEGKEKVQESVLSAGSGEG